MRKILSLLVVVSLLLAMPGVSFAKELKIGYVDIFEVFNEYNKTKEYDKVLEKEKGKEEKKLEKKKGEIEKLQNKLSLLNESEQTKEVAKLENAVRDYRETERSAFVDLRKQRDEKMKEIIEDIDVVVKDYAKKNKFDLVINENAVLYGINAFDITAQILKEVNSRYRR